MTPEERMQIESHINMVAGYSAICAYVKAGHGSHAEIEQAALDLADAKAHLMGLIEQVAA